MTKQNGLTGIMLRGKAVDKMFKSVEEYVPLLTERYSSHKASLNQHYNGVRNLCKATRKEVPEWLDMPAEEIVQHLKEAGLGRATIATTMHIAAKMYKVVKNDTDEQYTALYARARGLRDVSSRASQQREPTDLADDMPKDRMTKSQCHELALTFAPGSAERMYLMWQTLNPPARNNELRELRVFRCGEMKSDDPPTFNYVNYVYFESESPPVAKSVFVDYKTKVKYNVHTTTLTPELSQEILDSLTVNPRPYILCPSVVGGDVNQWVSRAGIPGSNTHRRNYADAVNDTEMLEAHKQFCKAVEMLHPVAKRAVAFAYASRTGPGMLMHNYAKNNIFMPQCVELAYDSLLMELGKYDPAKPLPESECVDDEN